MNFSFSTFLKLKLKIKWKLLIVFLAFTLFVIILTNTLFIISTRSLLRENIIDSHNQLAQHASFLVNNFMGAKISNLVLRSQTTSFLRKNIKDAQLEMSILLLQDGDIYEASFLDENGAELVKLTSDKVFSKEELTDQSKNIKFMVASFRYGQEYIGPVYFSPDEDPMITIAVPIVVPLTRRSVENISVIEPNLSGRLPGDILGVLSAEISLKNLLRSVSTVNAGQAGYVYVVDENHNLVAHPSIDLLKMNRDVSGAYILKKHAELDKELIQKQGGHPDQLLITGEGPSESGVKVLATYLHLPLLNWGVVVQESVAEVFAEINSLVLYSALLALLVLLMAVVAAVFFARKISRPIENLYTATLEFGKGNLDYRVDVDTNDEFKDLADSFNNMAGNLHEFDRKKSDFISIAAHQLRTPLSGIKWALRMLLNGEIGPVNDVQKTFLTKVDENNIRMINIVNDLLIADRLQFSKSNYKVEDVNISNLIHNVILEMTHRASKHNISIEYKNKSKDLPPAYIDIKSIRVVLQNLLENSVVYTLDGGKVEIDVKKEGNYLTVSIADNGIGIPEGQQKDVYKKFFRARNAVRQETDGTGLGLYIVKTIVEMNGGIIYFESHEGKGTTFYFTVPLQNEELKLSVKKD